MELPVLGRQIIALQSGSVNACDGADVMPQRFVAVRQPADRYTNDPIDAGRIGEIDRDGGRAKVPLRDPLAIFAAFGVPLSCVAEVHVYRGPGTVDEVPATVVNFLRHLYAQGCALGPAIMAFLHQGLRIGSGEAIYLAIVKGTPPGTQQVKAFIADYRD